MTKLLAFAASRRQGSYNQAILDAAVDGARAAGAEVTLVYLRDYDLPMFDEDEERVSGIPAAAQAFKELMMSHDGFLIACPEYNSSYPALFKNLVDWVSRRQGDEAVLAAFKGKVAGIMAASQGAMGGMRALTVLRMLLENVGTLVLPTQRAVGGVHKLLDEQGKVVDEKTLKLLHALGAEVADAAGRLSNRG